MTKKPLTYAKSGVNIDAGNAFISAIKPVVKSTARAGADGEIGGFGAFFDLGSAGFENPLLVAAADGVGTKLKLAIEQREFESIGIDVVAMCVNDIVVQGAQPLLFLDYLAVEKLNPGIAFEIVSGIAKGCKQADCALVGGETAEMPGLYRKGEFDIAGFSVGAVEQGQQLTGSKIRTGDLILGLASSGFHSNGYSLIRKVLDRNGANLSAPAPFDSTRSLGSALLEPTRIYVRSVLPEVRSGRIKALAHITGGGLLENVPRVLPDGLKANIYTSDMLDKVDPNVPRNVGALVKIGTISDADNCFSWLQREGSIEAREMIRTFNCGIGMVVVVSQDDAKEVIASLEASGEKVDTIGRIVEGDRSCVIRGNKGDLGQDDDWEEVSD